MRGLCRNCETQIWAGQRPHFRELLVCPTCLTDNSINPTPWQLLGDVLGRLSRFRQVYGWRRALKRALSLSTWQLERVSAYDAEVAEIERRRSDADAEAV